MQEAKAKREIVGKGSGRWHLIGHLQTNKAKQAVAIFDMIESADSVHLMQAVDKEAAKAGKVQEILLQVNIAREEQKQGSARKIMKLLCPNLTILKTCMCAG